MNTPHEGTGSGMHIPETRGLTPPPTTEEALQQMMERQRAMEIYMKGTEDAIKHAETRFRESQQRHEEQVKVLIEALGVLSSRSAPNNSETDTNPTGPREWKPPAWDGKTATFRDYLIRIRSSYKARSSLKPSLSAEYYWDTINDSLPYTRRARMRSFWEKGGDSQRRDPEEFFAALEKTFSDTMEKTKALEALVTLRHEQGQPWHEHQLIFDELLHGSHGDQWPDIVKIEHLKKSFSNPVRLNTVSMKDTKDYNDFVDEVSRIMNNYEETTQFKARHKAWLARDGSPKPVSFSTASRAQSTSRVDHEGDTIMTPARTTQRSGSRSSLGGNRGKRPNEGGSDKLPPRAKWVTKAELNSRKEKNLCFRCGGSGHRVDSCPYRAAVNPDRVTNINVTSFLPILEEADADSEESDDDGAGKV